MQNTELSLISKSKDEYDAHLAKSIWVRWLCIGLAWICLCIGTLGIIIPGLPTFDFYFLATLFAAKGSVNETLRCAQGNKNYGRLITGSTGNGYKVE